MGPFLKWLNPPLKPRPHHGGAGDTSLPALMNLLKKFPNVRHVSFFDFLLPAFGRLWGFSSSVGELGLVVSNIKPVVLPSCQTTQSLVRNIIGLSALPKLKPATSNLSGFLPIWLRLQVKR